jgi:hypothetical protein
MSIDQESSFLEDFFTLTYWGYRLRRFLPLLLSETSLNTGLATTVNRFGNGSFLLGKAIASTK